MSERIFEEQIKLVESRLLDSLECKVETVRELGRHILGAGGKRIRPQMVLLSCALVGYEDEIRLDLATAFELIHTATLIHDDIVDNSDQRRQRLSANALWSNATAVLSGDFLYSRAFELLTAVGNTELLRYISRTTNLLAQGELMQLDHIKTPNLTDEQYFSVIRHKTAYLFEACTSSVSRLTKLDPRLGKALATFGLTFGEAFQIRDDYLDYRGDIDTIGKPPGGDLRDGKPTLPYLHALKHCRDDASRQILIGAIRRPDPSGTNFATVVDIIETNGGFVRTRTELNERLTQLSACIDELGALSQSDEGIEGIRQLYRRLEIAGIVHE